MLILSTRRARYYRNIWSIEGPKYTQFTTSVESNTYTFTTNEGLTIGADATGRYTANGISIFEGEIIREVFRVNTANTDQRFVLSNKEYEDLIFSIIDRNLEIRASESVINKVIPGLIPTFDVALANKFDPKRVDWNDIWLASRKLDGVRCLAFVDENGKCSFYSRQGKTFDTLDVLKKEIESLIIVVR